MNRGGLNGVTVVVSLGAMCLGCSLDLDGTASMLGGDAGVAVDATSPSLDSASATSEASSHSDGEVSEDGGRDVPPDGSRVEASAPDGGCAGVICGGQCSNATTCATCAAGHALCASTRTCGDCSDCTDGVGGALPVACFACDANRQNPVGTCQPNNARQFCLSSTYPNGGTHCACPSFDVTRCPGANQVCVEVGSDQPVCVTCGETYYATDMAVCQGNASCKANANPPSCK